jgi:hypothetical protein
MLIIVDNSKEEMGSLLNKFAVTFSKFHSFRLFKTSHIIHSFLHLQNHIFPS